MRDQQESRPTIEQLLDTLQGPREQFRNDITDLEKLMRSACRYAELTARRKRVPAWSIIGEMFGHGSGVSSCIYELYRDRIK